MFNRKLKEQISKLYQENQEVKQYLSAVQDREQWWQPVSGFSNTLDILDKFRSFAYACIHKGAVNFAKGRPYVYRVQSKDKVEIERHPFLQIINQLNIYGQSYKDLLYWLYVNMKFYGIQIWKMPIIDLPIGTELSNKFLVGIEPIPSKHVRAVFNSAQTLLTHYEYIGGTKTEILKPEDIVVFKYPSLDNPQLWTAPISRFNFTLDIDYLQGKHRKAELLNGAKLSGTLQFPGPIDKSTKDAKEKEFEQNYTGSENTGRVIALGDGMKYIPMQQTAKEMDFQLSRKDTRDEILTILEVDKTVMGITDDVNLANANAGIRNWIENTIQPMSDTFYTPQINAFLKRIYGQRFQFDNEYEFETDRDLQLRTLQMYANTGKVTDNEWRELEGFETFKDPRADTIYRQDFFEPIIKENEETD